METVKDYIVCLNIHWMVMITAGLYTHVRQICIIGLCFEDKTVFYPTYSSLLFTFSVLSVFAEYKPWPRSLKKPPTYLLYIYEMLVASLVANLTTRVIWIPLLSSTWYLTQESSEWLKWTNSAIGLDNKSPIIQFANYMAKEDAACHVTLCISLLSFLWMMDATESLDTLLDYMTIMSKILYTLPALILHVMGVYIFHTCLSLSTEDEDEEKITKESTIRNFLFVFGIYVIIAQVSLFPQTFQHPPALILYLYEFLATLFILEFCLRYIWKPLDTLMLSTLPKAISHVTLNNCDLEQAGEWIENYPTIIKIVPFLFSLGFFLTSLHISKAMDFSIIMNYGITVFADVIVWNLYQRLLQEMSDNILLSSFLNKKNKFTNRGQQTVSVCKNCKCYTK